MHTEKTILALIASSDTAVKRAIKALAPAGFDGPDAAFLADIHAKLPRYNDRMTAPQYRRARKALAGYGEKLLAIANARMAEIDQQIEAPEVALERVPEDGFAWGSW
ncbi:hypothetical protein [Methylobacterium oryzae]|uniref:hypothetical protein n=1 Tax=Methylobacterium oryzae TaxID=334852 RepID=UPI001F490263|nr:hypothetical protein [Methylobacterium oryzae]UIN38379.1 hypothetical protein LXM90_30825 [Methylobacterium oryzae]